MLIHPSKLGPSSIGRFRRARNSVMVCLLFVCGTVPGSAQQEASTPLFKTTVRRVVVDVVVTDAAGNPIPGLKQEDFALSEDGNPQKLLSFEPNGFAPSMDYTPAKMASLPANTFVDLPSAPEKGPLYVLLYDLVNMDNEDQMALTVNQHEDQIRGRQQLVKFIQSKPDGARFAIIVWSDGPHLIQGFTSDKAELYAAIDPHSSRPHIPEVFLMGENSGRADPHATLAVLNLISAYLDGLPGRKNLIWFSGTFPLQLFPGKLDGPNYTQEIKQTLNQLARDQIAIYPVDVRGVVVPDWKSSNGLEEDGPIVSQRNEGDPNTAAPGAQTTAAKSAGAGGGNSLIAGSYSAMDQIAQLTGGRAFYSNNDVTSELVAATQNGENYYTLTYSPTNRNYDGTLRNIHLNLDKKGYRLAYRRTYYGTKDDAPVEVPITLTADAAPEPEHRADDTLEVNMKHGAPVMHQIVFAAHVHPLGTPAKGTPEQMDELAKQPAYARRKNVKLSPIPLQKFAIDYTVMSRQLQLQAKSMNLEIAAAAYDVDGNMLNATVNRAKGDPQSSAETGQSAKPYRTEQQIDVPTIASSIRLAIYDANTGRVGAMEIKLPLAPENQSADAGKKPSGTTN